jgi:hypothetical protein
VIGVGFAGGGLSLAQAVSRANRLSRISGCKGMWAFIEVINCAALGGRLYTVKPSVCLVCGMRYHGGFASKVGFIYALSLLRCQ